MDEVRKAADAQIKAQETYDNVRNRRHRQEHKQLFSNMNVENKIDAGKNARFSSHDLQDKFQRSPDNGQVDAR